MLIPIGFFGGGAPAGSYELIETTVLGSAASSVTFSSIASTYKHLQLRIVARSSRSSSIDNIGIRLNSDSGTNYATHTLEGTGSSVSSGARTGDTATGRYKIPGNTAPANAFGASVIDILDYASTSKNTTTRHFAGMHETSASQYQIILSSGLWLNTAAVSSIYLYNLNAGDFVTGSRFSLYGIKGA